MTPWAVSNRNTAPSKSQRALRSSWARSCSVWAPSGVGELFPSLGDDFEVGELERSGGFEQHVFGARQLITGARVGGEAGELADLGDADTTGDELGRDRGQVAHQLGGTDPGGRFAPCCSWWWRPATTMPNGGRRAGGGRCGRRVRSHPRCPLRCGGRRRRARAPWHRVRRAPAVPTRRPRRAARRPTSPYRRDYPNTRSMTTAKPQLDEMIEALRSPAQMA